MNYEHLITQTNEQIETLSAAMQTATPGTPDYNELFALIQNLKQRVRVFEKGETPVLRCVRCGNEWKPRRFPVKYCAGCKSSLWNAPRKYNNGINRTASKRTKATGRAAAALKPERIASDLMDLRGALYGKIDRQNEVVKIYDDLDFDHKTGRRYTESEIESRYYARRREMRYLNELQAQKTAIQFALDFPNFDKTKKCFVKYGDVSSWFIGLLDLTGNKFIFADDFSNADAARAYALQCGFEVIDI